MLNGNAIYLPVEVGCQRERRMGKWVYFVSLYMCPAYSICSVAVSRFNLKVSKNNSKLSKINLQLSNYFFKVSNYIRCAQVFKLLVQ